MSKEKKNRFYYSKEQSEIDEEMWSMPTRFTFVKTPDGWKQYSEWCSIKGSRCNWEDAILVYETDDEPEIIIHECIPELIADLEAKLAESKERFQDHKQVDAKIIQDQGDLIEELKQQLAEKDELIGTLKNKYECADRELYLTKDTLKHHTNIYNSLVESRNQDKISFALEQLELARRRIDRLGYNENKCLNKKDCIEDCLEEIDNQIKQLKGK